MEFLKLTHNKTQYLLLKLTLQKTRWTTHGAEEHDGRATADLAATVSLPWSLPNASVGDRSTSTLNPMVGINKVDGVEH